MFKWKTKKKYRILLLGGIGKTSFLYWNKLKEKVTSIPTIGFNVEVFEYNNVEYTCWDIGGCDKIRVLIKHYFEGIDAFIFFINTYDINNFEESLELAKTIVYEYNLPVAPTVFFFSHRDMSDCLDHKLVLEKAMDFILTLKDRPYTIQFGCSFGEHPSDHKNIFKWIEDELAKDPKPKKLNKESMKESEIKKVQDNKFTWMNVEEKYMTIPSSLSDELTDEEFVNQVESFHLQTWDHKSHLRLGYVILKRDSRRKAVGVIMKMIEDFIVNSNRTNGKTFHLTMTYFWIHMIHLAITLNPELDFNNLLNKCPWLMNGGLFKNFYTDDLMLRNAECRKVFHPPDIMQFPSII
jgi:GTPase SAR1 family protein